MKIKDRLLFFILTEEKEGTLHGRIGKTRVSFLRYSYRLLRPLKRFGGIAVGAIEDIALMKLGALIGRGMRKDFIDLFFILHQHSLKKLMKLGQKKFPGVEDFPLQVLKAMVYFDDAEKERMPLVHSKISWTLIKSFFQKQARAFTARHDR